MGTSRPTAITPAKFARALPGQRDGSPAVAHRRVLPRITHAHCLRWLTTGCRDSWSLCPFVLKIPPLRFDCGAPSMAPSSAHTRASAPPRRPCHSSPVAARPPGRHATHAVRAPSLALLAAGVPSSAPRRNPSKSSVAAHLRPPPPSRSLCSFLLRIRGPEEPMLSRGRIAIIHTRKRLVFACIFSKK